MANSSSKSTPDDEQRRQITQALPDAVDDVGLVPAHRGKVRDVFHKGNELLLVATDRVSAFDVVLGTIPLKGQLLTEQSAFWLERIAAVAPTHLIERVDATVLRCKKAEAFPVELVVRGHLAGSLMREPPSTRGQAYGVRIDPAIKPYEAFADPVITPTTKEAVGVHDQPCSLADLVSSGRIAAGHLDRVVELALALFKLGRAHADAQGLILVDTKYEFGVVDGDVVVIDEVHTADSSRFWLKASHAARVAAGEVPEMLDKENLRRWLLDRGFSGTGAPPALDDAVRTDLAAHYWTLTERVLGRPFSPAAGGAARVAEVVEKWRKA
ncbi:MAG: phosphoribosylaminoimidazolesuccinocarboxamide synthase [Deltaproteobacteria bacterium]|nr:phosphoribosylaminoimidazolesuccinocarboxamide synthase [Deltaproteobacteria bacterium]